MPHGVDNPASQTTRAASLQAGHDALCMHLRRGRAYSFGGGATLGEVECRDPLLTYVWIVHTRWGAAGGWDGWEPTGTSRLGLCVAASPRMGRTRRDEG